MQNDLLLPPWSEEWGKGGIKWVVLMEGISGMVKGVDASLGSFGKPWLDPWRGGDGEGKDGGRG